MFGSARRFLWCKPCEYGKRLLARYSTEADSARAQVETARQSNTFKYGQPTASTHPHLLKEGELMPGIKVEEFQKRRNELMQRILSCSTGQNVDKEQIVIIPAASKVYMSENIPYVFRQNTNFLYFTGCTEPDTILVITAKKANYHSTLFVKECDERTETWEGPRTNVEGARALFGIDQALPVTEFESFFLSFISECRKCNIWYDSANVIQVKLHKRLCELMKVTDKHKFSLPTNIIHSMRSIKSKGEINLLKKSCDIISLGIIKTIETSKPEMSEHELFATVDYESRMNGAQYLAYPPVVAGGSNATIIHYINNNQIIRNGNMVLMDAGCDYYGYSSDVTRTWPVNGTFTPQQRLLYEVVLDTQNVLIQKLKEMPTLDHLFMEMCLLLGKGLQEIGLLPKHLSSQKLLSAVYQYCPHHVSHYLGMDVHDTGNISRNIKVQPGMVVTVEPGIYVNPKNENAPQEFHGLGIRIEDDVFITENGPVVLSNNCPKSLTDIEKLASQNQ